MAEQHSNDGTSWLGDAAAVWAAAPDGMLLVANDGHIIAANTAAHGLFGFDEPDLVGVLVDVLVPDSERTVHEGHRAGFAEQPTRRSMGAEDRPQGQRRDGTVFPIQVSLTPWTGAYGDATLTTVRDMTDWVRAEARIATAQRRHLIAADHERIARDLHDTVIQELFSVGMKLSAVLSELDEPQGQQVQETIGDVDRVMQEIRSTIFGLRSPVPPPTTLRAAVLEVIESMEQALGFSPTVTLRGDLDPEMYPEVADHIGPVTRELLTNVAKHAGATRAEVQVCVGERVTIEVIDNGVASVDHAALLARSSGGLANLSRRADLLGGSLIMEANEHGGSTTVWDVPVS